MGVELEENVERVALTDQEASEARAREIEQARVIAAAKSAANNGAQRPKKGRGRHDKPTGKKPGRPVGKEPGSRRQVAEERGVDPAAQRRNEQRLAFARRFPLLARSARAA